MVDGSRYSSPYISSVPAFSSGCPELTEQHSPAVNASATGTGGLSFLSSTFTASPFYLSGYITYCKHHYTPGRSLSVTISAAFTCPAELGSFSPGIVLCCNRLLRGWRNPPVSWLLRCPAAHHWAVPQANAKLSKCWGQSLCPLVAQ